MLDLSRPLLLTPLPPHKGSTPRPAAIQIRLTEEILARLLLIAERTDRTPHALGLDLGTRPALILPDNTSYDLTLTAEQKNSELYRLVPSREGGIDRLESIAGIEIKASVNPGAGKSFEQVGVNLRESREASEKERESKRAVLLTSTGVSSTSSSRSSSLSRPKSISPTKRGLSPSLTSSATNGSTSRPLSRLSNSITSSTLSDNPIPVLRTSTSSSTSSSSSSSSATASTSRLPLSTTSKPLPIPVKAPTSSFRIGKAKGVLPVLPLRGSLGLPESHGSNGKEKSTEPVVGGGGGGTVGRAGGGGVMKGKESIKKEKQQTTKERERKTQIVVPSVISPAPVPRSEGSDADADADADADFEEVEVEVTPALSQVPTPPFEPPIPVKPDSSLRKKRKLLNGIGVDSPPSTAPTPLSSPRGISLARSKSGNNSASTSVSASASPVAPRKGKRQVKSERYYTSSEEDKEEEEEERGRGKKMRMSEAVVIPAPALAVMARSRLPHLKQEGAQAKPSSPLSQSAQLPPASNDVVPTTITITSRAEFTSYTQQFNTSYPVYLKLHQLLSEEKEAIVRGEGLFEEDELEKFVKKLGGMARGLEELRGALWDWKNEG